MMKTTLYWFDGEHQSLVGILFDDYLGYWYQKSSSSVIKDIKRCFRVAEGTVGVEDVQGIINKYTYESSMKGIFVVDGNKITNESDRQEYGVYNNGCIEWQWGAVWARPGS